MKVLYFMAGLNEIHLASNTLLPESTLLHHLVRFPSARILASPIGSTAFNAVEALQTVFFAFVAHFVLMLKKFGTIASSQQRGKQCKQCPAQESCEKLQMGVGVIRQQRSY